MSRSVLDRESMFGRWKLIRGGFVDVIVRSLDHNGMLLLAPKRAAGHYIMPTPT